MRNHGPAIGRSVRYRAHEVHLVKKGRKGTTPKGDKEARQRMLFAKGGEV